MTGRREVGGARAQTIVLTFQAAMVERIDAAAEWAGLSRSEWLRRAIESMLAMAKALEPAKEE